MMDSTEVEQPLAQLKPHPRQAKYFSDLSPAAIEALAADIRANGLHQPLEITRDGTIVCGHQRWRALQQLGHQQVRCKVYDRDPLDPQILERLIGDNIHRRQLSRLDVAKLYAAMKNEPHHEAGKLRDYLASVVGGVTGRSLDSYLKILEAPVEIQAAWDQRQLTSAQVQRVIAATPAQQRQIINRIKQGMSPKLAVSQSLSKATQATPGRLGDLAQRSDSSPLGHRVQQLIAVAGQCRDQRRAQHVTWEPAELGDLVPGLKMVEGLCKALLAEINASHSGTVV